VAANEAVIHPRAAPSLIALMIPCAVGWIVKVREIVVLLPARSFEVMTTVWTPAVRTSTSIVPPLP
jgi:hypothetical protein